MANTISRVLCTSGAAALTQGFIFFCYCCRKIDFNSVDIFASREKITS